MNRFKLDLQKHAKLSTKATFNPEKVLLSDAKTGELPETIGDLIIENVTSNALVSKLGKVEAMEGLVKKFTYLAEGPGAYWVGEGEKIQVDSAKWLNATMQAHKIGVIIPVTKEFLNFTVSDFFTQVKPHIEEAIRNKIDITTFFGAEDSPFGAGKSVYELAKAKGNTITNTGDMYQDLNGLMALVEAGDYMPQAFITTTKQNQALRGALDQNKLPIFNDARQGVTAQALGLPILYANKKNFDVKKADMLTGNFDFLRYGIPKGLEYSVSTEATLSVLGEDNKPINLWERDMIALKVTMHYAFMTLKDDAYAVLEPKEV